MAYLLDANAFIEAKNRWYGFDFCPAYWTWLESMNAAGTVFSIEKIKNEIEAVDDELLAWVQTLGDAFFLQPDEKVMESLTKVNTWAATSTHYDRAAIRTFFDIADSYLVAHAHAYGHIVVTQEQKADSRKKMKIPNACLELQVEYLDVFRMLRMERANFVLGNNRRPPEPPEN